MKPVLKGHLAVYRVSYSPQWCPL